MTYEEILSHFKVVKRSRNGASASCICPSHSDNKASLTITKKDGKTIMNCFAHCTTEDILEAVNLKMSDLFETDRENPTQEKWKTYVENVSKMKIEDVYNYVDCNGSYVFTRIRFQGKEFRYGILKDERFNFGLGGKKRESVSAVYGDVKRLRKAVEKGERVFYCEGEKDVNTLKIQGLTAITCGSADDWSKGCSQLFKDAEVVIFADNDEPGKKLSRKVRRDIKGIAKSVRIVVPTPDIEHGDISDYFKTHTVEDLEELLKESNEEPLQKKDDLDRFHHFDKSGNPSRVFDFAIFEYLKERENLFVLGGIPYFYCNGVFIADRNGSELKTMIRKLIYPQLINSNTIDRVYKLFVSDAELQVSSEELNDYPQEWINFKNGFYDPIGKKMIPHDPKYRAVNQIPHEYDPKGKLKGKTVQDWLEYICPVPEEGTKISDDREMLLQYSGLCMTRDVRQQKFLIIQGEGGSGKSTLIKLFDSVIGDENTSNISLNQLSQRFFAYGLMGKLLNSCADLEIDALSDVSTLKKVLGEDAILAEPKGKDPFSFNSYAKLIFSTNQLPIVKEEKTNGFYRRLLILTMDKVPEHRDPKFFDVLAAEIDDFIRLSVEALERMYQNGKITESASSKEAVKRLRCDSDTVEAFLNDDEIVVIKQTSSIKKLTLFEKYETYCKDLERQPLTKQNFYRSMRLKGYGEKIVGGVHFFRGVEINENITQTSPKTSPKEIPKGFSTAEDEKKLPFE